MGLPLKRAKSLWCKTAPGHPDPAIIGISLLLLCFIFTGCDRRKEVLLSGETMGTTYHVKIVADRFTDISDIEHSIEKQLVEINKSMSVFDKNSEISRFNKLKDTEEKLAVSKAFYNVMVMAGTLFKMTGGAWDGTLAPIINLWGFGPSMLVDPDKIPNHTDIENALKTVGFDQIDISEKGFLRKKQPSVSIDLNSIAKGYGVDQVALLLKEKRIEHFLVEIGGETIASGTKPDGENWRVGINLPRPEAPYDSVYQIIQLKDKALATSGDYRNFFEINGIRYSHVFDPRTGYPVKNSVVSVSVIADTCALADGLATALMVMGHERGLSLIDSIENVECMIIVESKDHTLTNYYSKGFPKQ